MSHIVVEKGKAKMRGSRGRGNEKEG